MLGDEIATYLASKGYGTVNTSIFYDFMPPDDGTLGQVICVMPYGGRPDEPDLGIDGGTTRLEYPRFQVIVRGVKDDNGNPKLKMEQIRKTLVAVLNVTLSGIRYVSISALSPVNLLMRDVNQQAYWYANFEAIKVPSV